MAGRKSIWFVLGNEEGMQKIVVLGVVEGGTVEAAVAHTLEVTDIAADRWTTMAFDILGDTDAIRQHLDGFFAQLDIPPGQEREQLVQQFIETTFRSVDDPGVH